MDGLDRLAICGVKLQNPKVEIDFMRNANNIGLPNGGRGVSLASQGFVTGAGTPGIVVQAAQLEAFNVCNHPQFYGPGAVNGNIASATFGRTVSAAAPRLVQVAAKVTF